MIIKSRPRLESLLAHGMELSSSLADDHPSLVGRFVGDNPVWWHIARVPRDTTGRWLSFEPNDASGFWANSYKSGVAFSVGRRAVIAEAIENNGVPAVAFALGKRVMAAELGDSVTDDVDDNLVVTMRKASSGPLITTVGTFRASDGIFLPVSAEDPLVIADDVPADALAVEYPQAIHR